MTESELPGSSRRRWWKATIVFAVAVGVILFVAPRAIDLAARPWSISVFGGSTLTGSWAGTVTLGPGDEREVFLELSRDRDNTSRGGSGARRADFGGTATICDSAGRPQRFEVVGDPENWSGSHFWMDLHAVDPQPGTYVSLGRIDGEWDEDTLRLRATPETIRVGGDGSASGSADTSSPAREIGFTLTRTDGSTPSCRTAG
jgi:hypothetical protein